MSESFEQLLNESFKTIKNGEIVKGTVIGVKENEIVVNISAKHDGIISKNNYTSDPAAVLKDLVKIGDEIEAKIVKVNDGDGLVQLTCRQPRVEKVSEVLTEAFNNGTVLTGVVDEVVKGGVTVTIDETKVFVPASLLSDAFERDLTKFQGQEISFVLTDYNPRRRRVIGDRKQLIVKEKEAALANVLANIHEGDVVEGAVKNVTDFGAFIDLGGADGLLHISEMGWGRIESPKRAFKTGDVVKAFVKSIDGAKIALSRKFPEENPWADAETKYAVGNVVTGKVARLTDFGAFIELAKDVDGLLHVSQISNERIEKPADALTEGQEITAKVIDLDLEHKKISLSAKALLPKPERKPKEKPAKKEEPNTTNPDGTFDIEAYIKANPVEEEAPAEAPAEE